MPRPTIWWERCGTLQAGRSSSGAYNHLVEVQEMMESIDKAANQLRDAIPRNAAAWPDHQKKLQEAKGVLRDILKDITNVTGIMPRKR
jgi:hypothetical protein